MGPLVAVFLGAAAAMASAAPPEFTDTFPWARTPTMCQTHIGGIFARREMVGTGRFSDGVVRFLAENCAIVVANGLEPGVPDQCQEAKVRNLADRIAAINPRAKVLIYEASMMVHSRLPSLTPPGGNVDGNSLCGLDNMKRSMLATTDTGELCLFHRKSYIRNLSDAAARQQWLDVLFNKSLGSNVAGVFADNSFDHAKGGTAWMSAARSKAYLRGQQELLASVVAAGKYSIFNGLRLAYTHSGHIRDDLDALDTLLPHASSGYFEPWLGVMFRDATTGQLDEKKATHALLRMIHASTTQPEKGITFKAGPGPCVGFIPGQDLGCTWPWHDETRHLRHYKMNGTPKTAAERRAEAARLITFPLATFLCAAGPKWHLDYGWGYTVNDFVPGTGPGSTMDGQPQMASNVPDEWYPDLLRAPGTPLGVCTYDATTSTFAREWSGVSVSLNMAKETAVLNWKETA